jgi:hypothetical protein
LLLAILFATPFFVVFGSLSDRIGRKWIMLIGMLLAVLTYPFLFRQLLTIPATEGRAEIAAQKEILSSVAFIGKSRDMIRTSTTHTYYEGGLLLTATQKDTVYASGKTSAKPVLGSSRTVGTADYWKMTGVLFLMVFYVTMVYGPIALPYHIGNGVFGGMTPFIATLLTTIYTGDRLVGLWYPVGIVAISLVVGAIYLPSKPKETAFDN